MKPELPPLVVIGHPPFVPSLSMPRFARMITEGMRARGFQVSEWTARPRFVQLPVPPGAKKWCGYLDQFACFPVEMRQHLRRLDPRTVFVVTDHALGPWVPLLAKRPHVIHCHDFIAQRSALGEIAGQSLKFSGRCYQAYIRRGFRQGRHFISISEATRADLHRFLDKEPESSVTIYNGLNGDFRPVARAAALADLPEDWGETLAGGYVLHVGGDQWYKNRLGVVAAYAAYVQQGLAASGASFQPVPLVLVGAEPSASLAGAIAAVPPPGRVLVGVDVSFQRLRALYSLASLLFFPSLAEGFGWPIAEAMACACPVLTTDVAPMTEVGGDAAEWCAPMPVNRAAEQADWAERVGGQLSDIINWPVPKRRERVEAGLNNARRFDCEKTLDAYAEGYQNLNTGTTNQ
ncbi:MAG: glycosyltransferase family 1 protein [Puniceicoccaceae bacterium]|nr:MAG: glycosyltransferase family 1 protein [Puniceicoccaceae bacterium]